MPDWAEQYSNSSPHYRKKKWVQEELPFHGDKSNDYSKEDYYSGISRKQTLRTLTDQEVNDLFWNTLIGLGWKLNTSKSGMRRIVFACPECEMIIDDLPYEGLQEKDARSMTNEKALQKMLITHNGEPCIPVGEYE